MMRSLVIAALTAALVGAGCRHEEWHLKPSRNCIPHAASRLSRWLEKHPLVVDVPVAALLLSAAAVALYLDLQDGTLDLSDTLLLTDPSPAGA
jgi:hypothetical protein